MQQMLKQGSDRQEKVKGQVCMFALSDRNSGGGIC